MPNAIIAWVNGHTFFAPLRPVPVMRRHPRTQFVTLSAPNHPTFTI